MPELVQCLYGAGLSKYYCIQKKNVHYQEYRSVPGIFDKVDKIHPPEPP